MSRVYFFLAVALGCHGGDLILPEDGGPAAIVLVDGDGQSGRAGAELTAPIVVRVTDGFERAIEGQRVAFVLITNDPGAELRPDTTVTDAGGEAAARWVLGRATGEKRVEARVVGSSGSSRLTVVFTASTQPAGARRVAMFDGDRQTGAVGTTLDDPLVIEVTDEFGNPVSGMRVAWRANAGNVDPVSVDTDRDGRAFTWWRLGSNPGKHTATAVVSGVGVIEFDATALGGGGGGGNGGAGTPARIVMRSGNGQTAPAGTALITPPSVLVTDASGNGVSGIEVTFAVVAGDGRITGTNPVTNGSGVATVGSWTLGVLGGNNRLTATAAGGGIAGNPVTFTATATATPPPPTPPPTPSGPDRLVFRVQPSRAEADQKIEPAVQVVVVDGRGNQVGQRNVEVRLELRGGDDRARLRGKTHRDTQEGIATFTDLKVDREGDGYRLRASADGMTPIESTPFNIVDD